MPARIAPLPKEKLSLFARFTLWFARRKLGKTPGSLRLLSYHDRMLGAVGMMETGLQGAKRVPATIKALSSLRAAQLIGCPF